MMGRFDSSTSVFELFDVDHLRPGLLTQRITFGEQAQIMALYREENVDDKTQGFVSCRFALG
jgi:hypothetical protein